MVAREKWGTVYTSITERVAEEKKKNRGEGEKTADGRQQKKKKNRLWTITRKAPYLDKSEAVARKLWW